MTSVSQRFSSFQLDKKIELPVSSSVTFDIVDKTQTCNHNCNKFRTSDETNTDQVHKSFRLKEWELDVRPLISSQKWLQNYGLKKNRLQLNQILVSIGFKISDEFDDSLKKPVSSRYASGLFKQLLRPDGRTFNINCSKEKLLLLEKRLQQSINLFKRRLEWLTTESRRLFGVIEERSITIVLDVQIKSPEQFNKYRAALEKVLREQVSQLAKFNLIRASEDVHALSPHCIPVSHDTIDAAIQWIWKLNPTEPVSISSLAESVLKAMEDYNSEVVYLFTEGSSVNSGKEILMDKVSKMERKVPIHVVSFNCDSTEVITILKDLAKKAGGRFHAYGLVMELETYETELIDSSLKRANTILKHKTIGGIPPGAGVREDVILIFDELEEARSSLVQIKSLVDNVPEQNKNIFGESLESKTLVFSKKDEQYMCSKEWLEVYGLNAKKLGLDDILSSVAFKHSDVVVDSMYPPSTEPPCDAVVIPKLVNAKYCEDTFPIVKWKDGKVMHVQVTPEIHRNYEEKVMVVLNKIQQRIDWLNKGSRSLFGTLVEEQMYILIDVSASISPSLGFVKQKIFALMQEQLRHKKKFNFVAFNSKVSGWKDRLVEVTESSMQSAWAWVQGLSCWGSTNTYAALQLALSDPQTQAIYLMTDGRPDQPPKSILAQVQLQKSIPIHTISFNCDDVEANQFLYSLAEITGGRYHYFSENGENVEYPKAWQSVDVQLLKDEIKRGLENVSRITELRDECTRLVWQRGTEDIRKSLTRENVVSSSTTELRDLRATHSQRNLSFKTSNLQPMLSLSPRFDTASIKNRPKSSYGIRSDGGQTHAGKTRKIKSASISVSNKPFLIGKRLEKKGHTRTSMLRTLSISGRFSPNEWLLPETKSLLDRQESKQRSLALQDRKREDQRNRQVKKLLKSHEMSSKQWLSKHGLHAMRLTLLDALSSTLIPHKPKYISILDKCVMSKVFDDVFPLGHQAKNQHLSLINPNGVNLVEYERKLRIAIEKIRRRLDNIVWRALPESEKQEFNSEQAISYEENKEKILNSLEKADWPIKKKDIDLLVEEIEHGEKFLRQSDAIRKAASGEEDYTEDSSQEQEEEADLADLPDHVSEQSDKIKYKEVKETHKTRKEEEIIQESMEKTVKKKLQTLKGQTVIARCDKDGLYYPAEVIKCPDIRHAVVRYFENGEATVYTRHIVPTGGAVARPNLTVGDYVLIRVVNLDNNKECYVPAIVIKNHQQIFWPCKCYTVIMYNGQKAVTFRRHLVKISKERFELAAMYISKTMHEDRTIFEEEVRVKVESESALDNSDEEEEEKKEEEIQPPEQYKSKESKDKHIILKELKRLKKMLIKKQWNSSQKQTSDQSSQIDLLSNQKKQKARPIFEWRKSLAPIKTTGIEVLARWLDDGWYYRSEIHKIYGDTSYDVMDSTGMIARVWREDIITEDDDREQQIDVDDKVIALYPYYSFSYAPGSVVCIESTGVQVKFYNDQTATVPVNEVYRIIPEKYKMDIKHIEMKERQLIGTAVVARDDRTGAYFPGSVKKKLEGQEYLIQWANGSQSNQNVVHIFGGFTREPKLSRGDCVLACADPVLVKFLPGKLIDASKDGKLTVQFCNGVILKNVNQGPCYWLSQEYYKEAKNHYESKMQAQ